MVNIILILSGLAVFALMIADNILTLGLGIVGDPVLIAIAIGLILAGMDDNKKKR